MVFLRNFENQTYYNFNLMRSVLTVVFTMWLFTSCKKDNSGIIPESYVNVSLYVSDPQFSQLNAVGGFIYYNNGSSSGYRGLIIYKRGVNDYVAYERACTYDPESTCGGMTVGTDNFTIKDECCGSKFQIYDGSVSQGPASYPMVAYRTQFDGVVLNITN